MPLRYRREIGPHYNQWATEGFDRYANHSATKAALILADEVLQYRASHGFAYQRAIQNYMGHLRDSGVDARAVLIRVMELVAFMDDNPTRLHGQREEDFGLARLVLHLAPYRLIGRPNGALTLMRLGPMVREACYPFAVALVRKLKADTAKRDSLRRQAGDFGET